MDGFRIRRLRAGEWRELRELRLAALREAPHAFSTHLAEAEARPDDRWQRDAARGASDANPTFVAEQQGNLVGMASGWEPQPGCAELVQMFVRTDARRQGIGAALVEAVAVWASARGHTRLELGVADANDEAERLYACCGFVRTGAVARHPVGNVAREVRMALEL